jgi:hypothetical protein
MPINAVNNNAPAGHVVASAIDFTVNELDTPAPKAPPGSIGHQLNNIESQLVAGNPGGVGVGFGIGIAFEAAV